METTFKIILDRRHPKKNLTLPLRLRIYQNRDYKELTLGIAITEADWNEQLQEVSASNPIHSIYNAKIASIKSKIRRVILFNEDEDDIITPDEIIKQISRKHQRKAAVQKPDILQYGKQHIVKLESTGHIGNSIVYSCAISKLQKFAKKDKLTFGEVNYTFIERFNTALLSEGIKVNSISNYFRTIRALFNKAIKDGIISLDCYPFKNFKIKSERTINRTLTLTEIKGIINLYLKPGLPIWHYRNLFLLSYCLIGINFSDLLTLTKENFVDGRIIFRRKKTHKVYSLFLHPKTQELLSHYLTTSADKNSEFVLPFIKNKKDPVTLKKDILQVIKNTNDYLRKIANLCEINKPISTYYSRYSWANIAKSLGYSKDMIAEALGHEYGNKITGIY
ncbi:MAG TPA: site-specific integrase, partial [Chitinophagaceae bacterium]|nr:site-specific integrase [Chitinophagaceae bacterium]